MDFYVRETPIDSLLEKLEAGRLGLPRFQRDFVWDEGRVLKLLTSVARRWPIGSFLVMEGPGFLQPRPVKGGPPLVDSPEFLILDGQQRMTGLYHAISAIYEEEDFEPPKSKVIYYVDFSAAIDGRGDDDIFKWSKYPRFRQQYPDREVEAQNLVAPIRTIYFESNWDAWMQHVPATSRESVVAARRQRLSGLREYVYRVPGLFLEKGIGIVPLTRIFVSVNRGAVSLDAFDLMTAKLIRHKFDLRTHWKDAKDAHEEVFDSFRLGGLDVLRALALIVRCQELATDKQPTVTGIRQDDVLELSHHQVESNWGLAVQSLVWAVELTRKSYGVHSKALLPNRAAFFVLAALQAVDVGLTDDRLEAWYWAAALTQVFAQGVNTQIIKEADDLIKWASDKTAVPSTLKHADVEVILATLDEPRRRNEILTRALQCLLLRDDACDLVDGKKLIASDYTVDITSLLDEDEPKSNPVVSYVCTKRKTRMHLRELLSHNPSEIDPRRAMTQRVESTCLQEPIKLMQKRVEAVRPLIAGALKFSGSA